LVMLFLDGYFEVKKPINTEKERKAERFFILSRRLSLDLLMLVVRRVYLSSRSFFLSHQTEAALRKVLSFPSIPPLSD